MSVVWNLIIGILLLISRIGGVKVRKFQRLELVSHVLLTNILYCLILSIILGSFGALLVIAAALPVDLELQNTGNIKWIILSITVFIFTCLVSILLLNLDRRFQINIPRILMLTITIMWVLRPLRQMKRSMLYVLVTTLLLTIALSFVIFSFNIKINFIGFLILSLSIISFLIAIMFYSEATIAPISRSFRQFALYLLVFIGFLYLNINQLFLFMNGKLDEQTVVSVGLLVLGLVFSLATVLDKSRIMLSELLNSNKAIILSIWRHLIRAYSIREITKKIKYQINELLQSISLGKMMWREGKRKKVIRAFAFSFLIIIIGLLIITSVEASQKSLDYFRDFLMDQWYLMFQEDKHLSHMVLICILASFGTIWFLVKLIVGYKTYGLRERLRYIGILTITLQLCSLTVANIYPTFAQFVHQYFMLPLLILMVLIGITLNYLK